MLPQLHSTAQPFQVCNAFQVQCEEIVKAGEASAIPLLSNWKTSWQEWGTCKASSHS